MCECTLPSENRPMKCSVSPLPCAAGDRPRARPAPATARRWRSPRLTSFAPCAKTRPAPKALWPTSLLPMSSSLGMPTAVPCARRRGRRVARPSARRASGVRAVLTASPSSRGEMPTPSRTTVTTGPGQAAKRVERASFMVGMGVVAVEVGKASGAARRRSAARSLRDSTAIMPRRGGGRTHDEIKDATGSRRPPAGAAVPWSDARRVRPPVRGGFHPGQGGGGRSPLRSPALTPAGATIAGR